MSTHNRPVVLVTGGGGYVGSALVPKLIAAGWNVKVLDLFLFGRDVFKPLADSPFLNEIMGDIRDLPTVEHALIDCEAVIHLACISNDPSFELNPALGRSINYECFPALVDAAKAAGVRRFIYASSSSVYGIKTEAEVTEDLPLLPLTDYSKYKAMCEEILAQKRSPGFATLTLRPATVCGYAPRQRLDVIVNILTNHAFHNRKIRVLGGNQTRPNIHIDDMADLYVQTLNAPLAQIDGKIFNAGYYNQTINEIAQTVRTIVGADVTIETQATDDNRSYHICSDKLAAQLGFRAKRPIEQAVRDLVLAFESGKLPLAMTDPKYYNIQTMQELSLR